MPFKMEDSMYQAFATLLQFEPIHYQEAPQLSICIDMTTVWQKILKRRIAKRKQKETPQPLTSQPLPLYIHALHNKIQSIDSTIGTPEVKLLLMVCKMLKKKFARDKKNRESSDDDDQSSDDDLESDGDVSSDEDDLSSDDNQDFDDDQSSDDDGDREDREENDTDRHAKVNKVVSNKENKDCPLAQQIHQKKRSCASITKSSHGRIGNVLPPKRTPGRGVDVVPCTQQGDSDDDETYIAPPTKRMKSQKSSDAGVSQNPFQFSAPPQRKTAAKATSSIYACLEG